MAIVRTAYLVSFLAVSVNAQKMYWTDPDVGKVQRAALSVNKVEDVVTGAGNPYGLALDLPRNKMYWTDGVNDRIQRANLNGTDVEDLVTTGLAGPVGIALDASRGKMYWADWLAGRIQRADLNGDNVEDVVTGLGQPMGVAIDSIPERIYWTDQGSEKIQRADLNGEYIEDLVIGLDKPDAIALDLEAGKIYWTETGTISRVRRAGLDGSELEDLLTVGVGNAAFIALDISAGKVYWTSPGKVRRMNLEIPEGETADNRTDVEELITASVNHPMGIALDTRSGVVLYVDDDATGTNDGASWCDAYIFLQDALAEAERSGGAVTDIRVGQGTYKPDQGEEQTAGHGSARFRLQNGVAIIGGHAGCNAPDPDARDVDQYETILSGDLAGDDGPKFQNYWENSSIVVSAIGPDATAVLDGVTVSGGHGGAGSGMTISYNTTVRNCTFRDNRGYQGAGMYLSKSQSVISNCRFLRNRAEANGGGGGLHVTGGSPILLNCTFTGNTCDLGGGGIGVVSLSSPTFVNCLIDGNETRRWGTYGGGAFIHYSSPTFINCTIVNNHSEGDIAGGVWGDFETLGVFSGCILWGNSSREFSTRRGDQLFVSDGTLSINHSCVLGLYSQWGGVGNIGDDPLFVRNPDPGPDGAWGGMDDDYGDLHLEDKSPCIDAGDNAVVAVTTDLDDKPRFVDDPATGDTGNGTPPIVDMGAYEFQSHVIPAVSEWGLLAMMLLVLAAGTVVLRRRLQADA